MFVFLIKSLRTEKKISLNSLSKLTGLSRGYLFDLENNRKFNPTLETLYKISSALDVNIKELFYSEADIEVLRKKMHRKIDKYGLDSKEVLDISQVIDLIINVKTQKNKAT